MDIIQDISKVNQLFKVYCTIELDTNGTPNSLKINEYFLGFI